MNTNNKYISYIKILNDMPNPIWRSGINGECDFFNKSWLDFTGRTLKEEKGDGWTKGVHPDDFEKCLKIYTENFKQQKPFEMEYRLKHKDGTYHYILDCGAPFYAGDGTFEGYIGSCYDIQSNKEYALKLEKNNRELTKINNIVLDRELKMVELKNEIKSLKKELKVKK